MTDERAIPAPAETAAPDDVGAMTEPTPTPEATATEESTPAASELTLTAEATPAPEAAPTPELTVTVTATVGKDETTPGGQKRLEGFVPEKIQELQDQAEKVLDLQNERMAITEEETKERKKLLEIMKARGIKRYPLDDNYVAEIEFAEEKAYVHRIRKGKRKKAADEDKE